jgi:hypothetical protein
MFPKIPENLEALSAAELRSLAREIHAAAKPAFEAAKALEDADERKTAFADVRTHMAKRDELRALADEKDEDAKLEAAVVEEVDEVTDEVTPEDPDDDDDGDDPDDAADGGTEVLATAGAPARRVRRSAGAAPVLANPGGGPRVNQLLALDGVAGKPAGEAFADWGEVVAALADRAERISDSSNERFPVLSIPGMFDEQHRMGDEFRQNLQMLQREPEITAQLCAPYTPNYDLACSNTDRRPVAASLPGYSAPRFGVKIYPSPTLADITNQGVGYGKWTNADDDNVATTKACATIACATPVDYVMYGIWRCITIQNMLAMSFPELVEAYLNRLAAAWARMAEIQLLEAMAADTTTVEVETPGYNGTTSVLRGLLQYLNAYQELQRWDRDGGMDVWLHRTVLNAMKADVASRRNTSGQVLSVPSTAQINAIFADAGFTPHWFLDRPTWVTPLPTFSVGGRLADFPRNVEMLVAPRGKFARMDGGNLTIGVTGNNIYRDNSSNARNRFTMFWESFEGVVNTDSCPAHIVEINNICWNGQQIADVVLDCEGQDEPGLGS